MSVVQPAVHDGHARLRGRCLVMTDTGDIHELVLNSRAELISYIPRRTRRRGAHTQMGGWGVVIL